MNGQLKRVIDDRFAFTVPVVDESERMAAAGPDRAVGQPPGAQGRGPGGVKPRAKTRTRSATPGTSANPRRRTVPVRMLVAHPTCDSPLDAVGAGRQAFTGTGPAYRALWLL